MDIGLVIRAVGVGLIVAVATQVLGKSGRDDQSAMVSLAGILTVLIVLIGELGGLIESVRSIFGI